MVEPSELEAEYCPPLDPSLFFAIVSDYDLDRPEDLTEVRRTLDALKTDAQLEDASVNFDPSGTSSRDPGTTLSPENTSISNGTYVTLTDDTSISQRLSSLQLDENETHTPEIDLDALDEDTKIALLIDVIGDDVSGDAVKACLHSCKGDWHAAMDELFTQAYFKEHGNRLVAKGIDGFIVEDGGRVSRKSKKKRNARSRASSADSYTSNDSTAEYTPSKWTLAKSDIDFIAGHTGLTAAAVRLTYNQQGASKQRTIAALLKQEMTDKCEAVQDENTVKLAKELSEDFPTIARPYVLSIVRMTSPSSAKAHELARALVEKPAVKGDTSSITPQYARVTEQDLNGSDWQKVQHHPPTVSSLDPIAYASLRAQAFSQASASYRKARSNPLYGGAAAYYSEIGRDYVARSHAASAAAADELAASQSSNSQVDLHGVDVLNGVRIAQEKVEKWWLELGENRANGRLGALKRSECFRIVVGRGIHSEGGKSKLGPAVSKMLKTEGWKFEHEGAIIAVSGRQNRT